jgi:hypothetical protein
VFKPQVTKNQDAALKALKATGTPEFWISAAHTNSITDKDELFASYAAKNQVQLAKTLGHKLTPQEDVNRELEVVIICCLLFVGFIGVWIAVLSLNG